MDKNRIERKSVNALQEMLDDINDISQSCIEHSIASGDKVPITDGFIRIDGKEIAIQLKGRMNSTNKMQIEKKYLDYAKENLLLFIMVDDIKEMNNSNIYYEFLSRNKLENMLKGKPTKKSIMNIFKNKMTCDSNCKFVEEFIKEFDERDKNKRMKLNEIKDKGDLKFNVIINNDRAFNDGHEVRLKKFTNSETGLSYQINEEPNSITKLFAIQEGEESFVFEDIKLNFKKKFDHITKNLQLSCKHFIYTLYNDKKINIQYTPPIYANDICIESYKFNKRLLEETGDNINIDKEYNSTLNAIKTYEMYSEVESLIGLDVKIPFNAVTEVYEFLKSKNPVNKFGTVKYFIEDTTLDFYWNGNEYIQIDSSKCKIVSPDGKEIILDIPYYFIFLFQGIINPNSISKKLLFPQYNLSGEAILIYVKNLANSGLDKQTLSFNIKSICYNLLLYFNRSLLTENLAEEIIQIGQRLLDDDVQILGLVLKKLIKGLNFKEKQYVYSVMEKIKNGVILYLVYWLVDASKEYNPATVTISEHQNKIISQLKEEINAED